MHSDNIDFLKEATAQRRAAFALKILTLRDHHDGLLADHARMINDRDSGARLIGRALGETLLQMEALRWQQREEENILRSLHGAVSEMKVRG